MAKKAKEEAPEHKSYVHGETLSFTGVKGRELFEFDKVVPGDMTTLKAVDNRNENFFKTKTFGKKLYHPDAVKRATDKEKAEFVEMRNAFLSEDDGRLF